MTTPLPRIELLGCFQLVGAGEVPMSGTTLRRLLALMALRRRPMTREQVASVLWPDVKEKQAMGRLRTALWRLGSARPHLIRCEGDHLELADTCVVDLHDAETLGRALLSEAIPRVDASVIELFSNDLLPDWDEPWVDSERECFRETRVHVLEAFAARYLESGDFLLAIDTSLRAIRSSPFRDTSHRLLVRAYREEGNSIAALRHLLAYRREVGEELGVPPERVLPDLLEELVG